MAHDVLVKLKYLLLTMMLSLCGEHAHALSTEPLYLPIIRVSATYPANAREAGIEGYCIVQFDVNDTGTVKKPSIVECLPTGYFERSVIDAISRFKYRPTVIDRVPLEVIGIRETFWFSSPSTSIYSHYKPSGYYYDRYDCSKVARSCKARLKAY